MKKILPLCLCAALLIALASCRGVADKPFSVNMFIPGYATVSEQTPVYVAMDTKNNSVTIEQAIDFYKDALSQIGAQQTSLEEHESAWMYEGVYAGEKRITVSIRRTEDYVNIFVSFMDEKH